MADPNPRDFRTLFPLPSDEEPVPPPPDHAPTIGDHATLDHAATHGEIPAPDQDDHAHSGDTVLPPAAGADFQSTAASPAFDSATSIRDSLLALQLISPADWDAAAEAVGAGADARRILFELTKVRASWSIDSTHFQPALTDFQVQQILADRAERLLLEHYIILERLGAGGMGEVFKARNLNLPRLEAVKTILSEGAGSTTGTRSQELERFQREARLLAQLDHPYITTVHHAGRAHGLNFIAMEFVSGQNLKQIVEETKGEGETAPVWWSVERIIGVAEALQHAHEKGIIHRDVKPQNVMITEKGDLRVLDLGIARLAEGQPGADRTGGLTQDSTSLGTPDVMSPEQWADAKHVTAASDIYSLGCTLFYLLTGRMPYTADTVNGLMFAHVNDDTPRVSALRPEAPVELDDVIGKMLAKMPEDRYPSAQAVIEALEPFAVPQDDSDASTGQNAGAGKIGKLVLAAIGALVLFGAAFYGVRQFLGQQRKDPEVAKGIGKQDSPKTKAVPKPQIIEPPPVIDIGKQFDSLLAEARDGKLWPDPAKLRAFATGESGHEPTSKADLDQVRQVIETETARRRELVRELDRSLAGYRTKRPIAWENDEGLKRFSRKLLDKEGMVTGDLDAIRARIIAESKERIDERLKEELGRLWKSDSDIYAQRWGDRDRLFEAARGEAPAGGIATEKQLENVLGAIGAETWESESGSWITENHENWTKAWKRATDLRRHLELESLAKVRSRDDFDSMKDHVRREAAILIQQEAKHWLDQFQRDHEKIWPDIEALRAAASEAFPNGDIVDDATFETMTEKVSELTPNLRFHPRGNPLIDHKTESLVRLYKKLLGLTATEPDQRADFDVRLRVDNRPVEGKRAAVRKGAPYEFQVRTGRKGYLTILFLAEAKDGRQYARSTVPIEPSDKNDGWIERVVASNAEENGEKIGDEGHFVFFLTETDPMIDRPDLRLVEEDERGFLPEVVVLNTAREMDALINAFSAEEYYLGALECLKEGRRCDFMPARKDLGWWDRKAIEMRIER